MRTEAPIFVRLLHLLGAIRELAPFSEMSADEEQLLGDLIIRWHRTEAIRVSDMMRDETRTSGSTIYRRLIALRDKGIILLRTDSADRRVKFVEPTDKAHAYMQQLTVNLDTLIRGAHTE